MKKVTSAICNAVEAISCPFKPISRSITPVSCPIAPPQAASSSKRTLTPDGSPDLDAKKPKLKKVTSAIHNAFEVAREAEDLGEKSKFGLLKFFSKGTAGNKKAYFEREDARAEIAQSIDSSEAQNLKMGKMLHDRELARHRQQKRRKGLKEQEIKCGQRSPRGTKRKVHVIKKFVGIC